MGNQRDVTALPLVKRLRESAELLDKAIEFMDDGGQTSEAHEDIALWREAADEIERLGACVTGIRAVIDAYPDDHAPGASLVALGKIGNIVYGSTT